MTPDELAEILDLESSYQLEANPEGDWTPMIFLLASGDAWFYGSPGKFYA